MIAWNSTTFAIVVLSVFLTLPHWMVAYLDRFDTMNRYHPWNEKTLFMYLVHWYTYLSWPASIVWMMVQMFWGTSGTWTAGLLFMAIGVLMFLHGTAEGECDVRWGPAHS